MTIFADAGAPPEAFRRVPPSLAEVDAHPDRDFIWAVILATRRDMRLTCGPGPRRFPFLEYDN